MTEEEDPARPLTDDGSADVRRVIDLATSLGSMALSRILHSGKTRARQTAELWGEALRVPVEEVDGLGPTDDAAIWAGRVHDSDPGNTGDLMLAGHMPHVARLTSLLAVGDADRQVVGFEPGGLVVLETGDDTSAWTVRLVLPPTL